MTVEVNNGNHIRATYLGQEVADKVLMTCRPYL